MHCDGKCYLKKQEAKEAETAQTKTPVPSTELALAGHLPGSAISVTIHPIQLFFLYTEQSEGTPSGFSDRMLHPPPVA